jgi:hypothetical protein
MRSAVGLLIHDRRLAELPGTRGGSAEVRQFSAQWKSKLNPLQIQLEKLAELNRIELPKDMTDVSRARLAAVASQSGPDFDRGLLSYTQASLNEEVKLFWDSIRKMKNQEIRHWAQSALDTALTQSSAAQRLSSSNFHVEPNGFSSFPAFFSRSPYRKRQPLHRECLDRGLFCWPPVPCGFLWRGNRCQPVGSVRYSREKVGAVTWY